MTELTQVLEVGEQGEFGGAAHACGKVPVDLADQVLEAPRPRLNRAPHLFGPFAPVGRVFAEFRHGLGDDRPVPGKQRAGPREAIRARLAR